MNENKENEENSPTLGELFMGLVVICLTIDSVAVVFGAITERNASHLLLLLHIWGAFVLVFIIFPAVFKAVFSAAWHSTDARNERDWKREREEREMERKKRNGSK